MENKLPLDISGMKFGKLTVLYREFLDRKVKNSYWKCECECGKIIVTVRCNLIRGHTNSCGCIYSPNDFDYEKLQEQRFFKFVEKTDTCWLWTGCIDKQGYGSFNHRSRMLKAHRYSYSKFNGSLLGGMLVCHTCDNPKCVNPDHLYLGTPKDNSNDLKDRSRWGNERKRYSDIQKRACKALRDAGFSIYEISELLKVSPTGVLRNESK